jgi:hypothetical protein
MIGRRTANAVNGMYQTKAHNSLQQQFVTTAKNTAWSYIWTNKASGCPMECILNMNKQRVLWEIKRAEVIVRGIPILWKYLIVYEVQDFLRDFCDRLINRLIKIDYKTQKENIS